MRVILDTNVFIDGLIGNSDASITRACRTIINAWQNYAITIVMNAPMEEEFIFTAAVKASQGTSPRKFPVYLRAIAKIASSVEKVPHLTNWNSNWIYDTTDKMFVECAIDGNVSFVVSNDYALKQFIEWNSANQNQAAIDIVQQRGIQFLTPERFVRECL